MIRERLEVLNKLEKKIASIRESKSLRKQERLMNLKTFKQDLLAECKELNPAEKVYLARHLDRPRTDDYVAALFTDFFPQRGDHLYDNDKSILGGIGRYHGQAVTIVGQRKGHTAKENVEFNFGMACPEGYRKAMRIMEQAEKFRRPIITFVDTPGAYPGKEAEEHGQGEAIARSMAFMSKLTVPVVAIVIGEGNSGGALALSVANRIIMLENSVYSVLSPEGFASILWKDASRHEEACEIMKLTAEDLKEAKVADAIVEEPLGGAQRNPKLQFEYLDKVLEKELESLKGLSPAALREDRFKKFRSIGGL